MYDSERTVLISEHLPPEVAEKYFASVVKYYNLKSKAANLEVKCKASEAKNFFEWEEDFFNLLQTEKEVAEITVELISFELEALEKAREEMKITPEKPAESDEK